MLMPEPLQPVSRRALLRSATAAAHRELDTLAGRLDLTQLDDYRRYLIANAGPLVGLEQALEASGIEQVLPDWSQRTRRRAITEDLRTLGAQWAPLAAACCDSRAALLGAAYVLEGSRLGAQALRQRVACSADARILSAMRFLHASHTSQWPAFLRVLESSEPVDAQALTASALQAFALFETAFAAVARDARPA